MQKTLQWCVDNNFDKKALIEVQKEWSAFVRYNLDEDVIWQDMAEYYESDYADYGDYMYEQARDAELDRML